MRLSRSQRLNRYKEVEYEAAEYDPPKVILKRHRRHCKSVGPDGVAGVPQEPAQLGVKCKYVVHHAALEMRDEGAR